MTEQYQKDAACSNCDSFRFPSSALKLYESTDIQNAHEALTVLFHIFMLENKFKPRDDPQEEKYMCMPKNWNADGVSKIVYTHSCCPEFSCCMTCVPIYKTIAVNGSICDIDCPDNVNFKVNAGRYVRPKPYLKDIFQDFHELCNLYRSFLDGFYLPLLNLLHESHGISPLYGLNALYDEMKMSILEYLPVRGVLAMSVVNKKFNELASSKSLWKHLYLRDYGKDGVPDTEPSSSEINWKEKYKKEYLKKKPRPQVNIWPRLSQEHMPCIVPVTPFFEDEFGFDFDPRFRFPPPYFSFPPNNPSSLPKYFRRLI